MNLNEILNITSSFKKHDDITIEYFTIFNTIKCVNVMYLSTNIKHHPYNISFLKQLEPKQNSRKNQKRQKSGIYLDDIISIKRNIIVERRLKIEKILRKINENDSNRNC